MQDQVIIALYNERNELAIAETEAKYGRFCHTVAYNILHNNEDAEECVNDTWVRTWNAIPPACPDCLRAFLGRITRNLAFDRCRYRDGQKRGGGERMHIRKVPRMRYVTLSVQNGHLLEKRANTSHWASVRGWGLFWY